MQPDDRLASRLRFQNPATFVEFYDKQLARALLAVRHPRPVPEGTAIIIVIMFFGRLGPLTLGFFLAVRSRPRVRYPEGQVFLG